MIKAALTGAGVVACLSMTVASIRLAWPQVLEDPSNIVLAVNQLICSVLRLGVAFNAPWLKQWKTKYAGLDAILSACIWLTQIAKDILVVVIADSLGSMQLSLKSRQAGISVGVYEIVHQFPLYTSGLLPPWVMLTISTLDAAVFAHAAQQITTEHTWSAKFATYVLLAVLPSYIVHHAKLHVENGKQPSLQVEAPIGPNINLPGISATHLAANDEQGEQQPRIGPALVLSPVQASRLLGDAFIDYRSPLFRQTQVLCSKVKTDYSMAQVPHDLAQQLQESLSTMAGRQFHLSDVAMREGCLLIRQELIAGELPPALTSDTLFGSHEQLMGFVTAQLPHLQHVSESGGGAAYLNSGEYIQSQLGDMNVRCFWDAGTQAWQFIDPPEANVMANGLSSTAGLGQIRCVSETPGDVLKTRQAVCLAGTAADLQWYEMMELLIEVQITGVVSGLDASLAQITGFTTATNKKLLSSTDWAVIPQSSHDLPVKATTTTAAAAVVPLQILACVNGVYCETEMVDIQPLERGSTTAVATVRVKVDAAAAKKNMRHALQSRNCLSPLIIELWSTNTLLKTASIVTLAAPTEQTVGLQPCQWWGSKPATVTAAMVEFSAATDELWKHHDDPQAIRVRCELNHDMRLWLAGIRDSKQAGETCKMGSERSESAPLGMMGGISFCQLSKLAQTLSAYAKQASLHQLQRMIKKQLAYLSSCQPRMPDVAHSVPGSNTLGRAVKTAWHVPKTVVNHLLHAQPWNVRKVRNNSRLSSQPGAAQCVLTVLLLAFGCKSVWDWAVGTSLLDLMRMLADAAYTPLLMCCVFKGAVNQTWPCGSPPSAAALCALFECFSIGLRVCKDVVPPGTVIRAAAGSVSAAPNWVSSVLNPMAIQSARLLADVYLWRQCVFNDIK